MLDACVLFSAPLRDTLLRATNLELYRALWTAEILTEVQRNLVSTGRSTPEKAQRLVDQIRTYFSESLVTDYEQLIDSMPNHPKDKHVLAAAVIASATVIITYNLRDFPREALAPLGIEAQAPDTFLTNLFAEHPQHLAEIIVAQAADYGGPPKSAQEVLDVLALQAPSFVSLVRDYLWT